MRWIMVAPILVQLLGCGTASVPVISESSVQSRAIDICTVIKSADKYDGREILVSGLYRIEPHGAIFFGRSCSSNVVRLLKTKEYREKGQTNRVMEKMATAVDEMSLEVVYHATFRIVQGLQCSVVRCYRYEIEASELIAARPTKVKWQ